MASGCSANSSPSTASTGSTKGTVDRAGATTSATGASIATTATDIVAGTNDTSTSSTTGSTGSVNGPITPAFDPSLLPPLPAATTMTGADPTSRAAELVAATADGLDDVTPGWLAAYAEFDVPVVDARDVTEPVDPVGPMWDQVWAIGQTSRGSATLPWPDLMRAVALDNRPDAPLADPQQILDELRTAATSADPQAQTFARFIAGKSVSNGFADPLDPATTVGSISLDAATIQLLMWVVLREALVRSIAADLGTSGTDPSSTSPAPSSRGAFVAPLERVGGLPRNHAGGASAQKPCSEVFGTSQVKSWTIYFLNKFSGGFTKSDEKYVAGLVEKIATQLTKLGPKLAPAAKIASKITNGINWANAAVSLLSLLAQFDALNLDVSTAGEPPLIRRKDTQPGSNQNLSVSVNYRFNKLNINNPILCIVSYVANISGIGLSIPEDGAPVPGSRVIATEAKNMWVCQPVLAPAWPSVLAPVVGGVSGGQSGWVGVRLVGVFPP